MMATNRSSSGDELWWSQNALEVFRQHYGRDLTHVAQGELSPILNKRLHNWDGEPIPILDKHDDSCTTYLYPFADDDGDTAYACVREGTVVTVIDEGRMTDNFKSGMYTALDSSLTRAKREGYLTKKIPLSMDDYNKLTCQPIVTPQPLAPPEFSVSVMPPANPTTLPGSITITTTQPVESSEIEPDAIELAARRVATTKATLKETRAQFQKAEGEYVTAKQALLRLLEEDR